MYMATLADLTGSCASDTITNTFSSCARLECWKTRHCCECHYAGHLATSGICAGACAACQVSRAHMYNLQVKHLAFDPWQGANRYVKVPHAIHRGRHCGRPCGCARSASHTQVPPSTSGNAPAMRRQRYFPLLSVTPHCKHTLARSTSF